MKIEDPSQLLSTFFGLKTEDVPFFRLNLFNQIHESVFHSKGGYDWETIYKMPIWLRLFTFKKIKEFYEEESRQIKDAQNTSKSKGKTTNALGADGKLNIPASVASPKKVSYK